MTAENKVALHEHQERVNNNTQHKPLQCVHCVNQTMSPLSYGDPMANKAPGSTQGANEESNKHHSMPESRQLHPTKSRFGKYTQIMAFTESNPTIS